MIQEIRWERSMHHLRLLSRGGSSLGRNHLSRRSSNRGSGSGRYGTTLTSFPCAGLGVPQVSQELGVHLQRSKQNKTMRSTLWKAQVKPSRRRMGVVQRKQTEWRHNSCATSSAAARITASRTLAYLQTNRRARKLMPRTVHLPP